MPLPLTPFERLAVLLITSSLWAAGGCGSTMVDPGRNYSPPPAITQSPPAGYAPGAIVDSPDGLPHVPLSQLLPQQQMGTAGAYHEVRPGETLSSIARMHQVSVPQLQQANGFNGRTVLQPGQLISIPGR